MKVNDENLNPEQIRLLRRFFIRRGELIPINEEEVKLFEASQGKQDIKLPESLSDFNKLLERQKNRK